ncbi:MAG: glycosyltransferase family 4 protein [Parcubacteria group bacterium]|nr:glycosyltransferase family 4 protein [Parcubacteria group bacterium]
MKLLVITQKVDKNDPVLGFFYNWVREFAKRADRVFVIANEVGECDLQKNVEIFSLGKEKGYGKIKRYLNAIKLIKRLSKESDGIFVHMCPEYAILAWLFSTNKKILMWYVHKSKNLKLWLAEKMVDKIFTVSKDSCQVKSKKIEIVGHGINTEQFKNYWVSSREPRPLGNFFEVLSVGRISPIKDYKTLVRAMCYLVNKKGIKDIRLTILGDAYLDSDLKYKKQVQELINRKRLGSHIRLCEKEQHSIIMHFYNNSDLLVNLCPTGGMDKVVLEAVACEIPVLVANKSFESLVGDHDLIFEHGKSEDLAEKILKLKELSKPQRYEIGAHLREQVVEHHNLSNLIQKITSSFLHPKR